MPSNLVGVNPAFHVFMLRKYLPHSSHIIQPQEVQLDETLFYEEVSMFILDRQAPSEGDTFSQGVVA